MKTLTWSEEGRKKKAPSTGHNKRAMQRHKVRKRTSIYRHTHTHTTREKQRVTLRGDTAGAIKGKGEGRKERNHSRKKKKIKDMISRNKPIA
jgi:hypothetical protein